jgi:AraC-like DNA-binding protein
VELAHEPTAQQLQILDQNLRALGFELLDNHKQKQIEKIKSLLIDLVQRAAIEEHFSLSEFLGKAMHKDYSYASRLFSGVEGMTIEQFFILQKIEKAKELLVYDELSLSEIAWKMGYSSVAHLSSQFKKLTGLTPSAFKKIGGLRKALDKVGSG